MSAVDDWKAQRGTGHNYATPALADAAIAELEAGNQALMEMCNNCERLEKAEAELAEMKAYLDSAIEDARYFKEQLDLMCEKAYEQLTELAALQDGIYRRIEQEVAADTADLLAKLRSRDVQITEAMFDYNAKTRELAELKSRRCGTCLFSEICLAHVDSTEGLFPVESCSRWTPQP